MFNNWGHLFILILGIAAHAHAASIKDCFAKYGVLDNATAYSSVLGMAKFGCAAYCTSPDEVKLILARQEINIEQYEPVCEQLLGAGGNVMPLTFTVVPKSDCYSQFGVSKNNTSPVTGMSSAKWGCANYCENSDLVRPVIALQGVTIKKYEIGCELMKRGLPIIKAMQRRRLNVPSRM